MFKKLSSLCVAVGLICLCLTSTHGFVQNYGDFNGTTVMYLDVTESNNGVTALFGAPSITGDLLDFDPIGFNASSSGPGAGSTIVDGQLNMTIMSNNANEPITNVIFNEAGDYTLAGLGPALAQATVGMAVIVNVTEVNGVPQFVPGGQFTMTFSPNSSFSLPGDLGTSVPWSGHLNVDIAAIVAGATKVEIVLDNTLTAAHANGGSAFIAKKDFRGLTITIPEPGYFGFASLVGMALLAVRRRLG